MLENMTVLQLRELLDTGKITSAELTEYFLKRIRSDKTNSFITVFEKEATEAAQKADKLISRGKTEALTGIPIAVKDNICTKGGKTTCASKMLSDFVPTYDADAVKRLREQGAVIIGKTNMDEFGMGSHTRNSYFGATCNPLDLSRSCGGSSGGSAAAVAAGLVPCALGSDTGGSVRQPSAYCGTVGIKPTYGSVSRHGLIAYASSLDQIGVIAKNARDCALVLDAISDVKGAETALRDVRIGVIKELADCADAEVADAVRNAAAFYRKNGFEIREVSLPSLRYAVSAYYVIAAAEAASNLGRYDGIRFGHRSENGGTYDEQVCASRSEGFGIEVQKRILLGNFVLSDGNYGDYYKKAVAVRARIAGEYRQLFGECDLLLSPTATTVAPLSTEKTGYEDDLCTVSASLAGLPSLSIPCGKGASGMPIGLSLTAKHFNEALLFAMAEAFEKGEVTV